MNLSEEIQMLKKGMISFVLVAALALFQTSCATKTGKGAAIGGASGAAAGAGIGALIGGKNGALAGAAIGAVAGTATGAAIGRHMDKKEAKLRQQVKSANIERVGNELIVRFPSGILFDSGKASLKPDSQGDLSNFAAVLTEDNTTNLIVEGHTDSDGSASYNQSLSQNRAQSVSSYLSGQGVPMNRMTVVGAGESKPVADNSTPEGKAANRRVVVKIIPDAAAIEKMNKG